MSLPRKFTESGLLAADDPLLDFRLERLDSAQRRLVRRQAVDAVETDERLLRILLLQLVIFVLVELLLG